MVERYNFVVFKTRLPSIAADFLYNSLFVMLGLKTIKVAIGTGCTVNRIKRMKCQFYASLKKTDNLSNTE